MVLHWLGEMFDPALAGYWGQPTHEAAMDVCLDVIAAHADKVDGIKISLLSKEKEIAMRRRLPAGVRMYTGDDFNYAELIAGDDEGHSDALLGIFDAIAPAASAALAALGRGSDNEFFELLEPTVPLSRHIFAAPTRFYKTGVVFLAWLNGLQDHFAMIGGQQSTRSVQHFAELFRLADKARVLADPALATTDEASCGASVLMAESPPASLPRGEAGEVRAEDPPLPSGEGSPMNGDRMPDRILSMNLATLRNGWSFGEMVDGCIRHGVTAISPWRDQIAAVGLEEAARIVHGNNCASPASAAAACFPPIRRRAGRRDRRQSQGHRRSGGAWCRLPGAGGGRAAGRIQGHRRCAASRWRTGSRRCCPMPAPRTCHWRSSRCTRCMRPTAPA